MVKRADFFKLSSHLHAYIYTHLHTYTYIDDRKIDARDRSMIEIDR